MHLYLIGYRGSGKTTVGRLLAQRLGWPMVDTDVVIEAEQGVTIRQIFAEQGEQGFRDVEQAVVARVASSPQATVVSLGGGAVLRPENQAVLRATGRCVWLDASAQALYQRICDDSTTEQRRPNLTDRGGYAEVAEVLQVRRPIYAGLAELTVNVEAKSPDQISREVLQWLSEQNWVPL